MNRQEAIAIILSKVKQKDAVISTTGMISREAAQAQDRQGNFYMIGSMGLASSFALGVALNSQKRVFILEGDGSALMDLGTLANIAAAKVKNLIHIVLDNQTYQSTGDQPTISRQVSLEKVALACGYRKVFKINDTSRLAALMSNLPESGPVFILIKVAGKSPYPAKRVGLAPDKITVRMINFLRK